MQGLRRRFDANPNDSVVGDYAELLLGWSLLAEGSEPHDPVRFTQLVAGLMETGLDAAPAAPSAASESPSEPQGAEAVAAESVADETPSAEGASDTAAADSGAATSDDSEAEKAASAD